MVADSTSKPKLLEWLPPLVILVSIVWTVATIQGTTEKLGMRIDQLGVVIIHLNTSVLGLRQDSDNLKERVIRLELTQDRDSDREKDKK